MITLKNSKPNILVVGDLMIDHYLWGSCERISPEAPVQVVDIATTKEALDYEPRFEMEDAIKDYVSEIKRLYEKEVK